MRCPMCNTGLLNPFTGGCQFCENERDWGVVVMLTGIILGCLLIVMGIAS